MPPQDPDATIARRTFKFDTFRAALMGLLEAGWNTFALLVVTEHFRGSAAAKAVVPAAFAVGLLATPVFIFYVSQFKVQASKLCAILYVISGSLLAVCAVGSDSLGLFLAAGTLAAAVAAQQMPLLVSIYTTNYPSAERGRKVSVGMALSVGLAMPFGLLGGALLERDLSKFPILFAVMAACCFAAAWCVGRIPSQPLKRVAGKNPLGNLGLFAKDRVFAWMLIMWMILGFGNLATMPLRIEFMTDPVYGISATYTQVAIASIIVPSAVRILCAASWGKLFDLFDYFFMRGFVSLLLVAAMALFFFAPNLTVLYVGAAFYGLAIAGANVNWSLWVTKFAPPGNESNYMSVHTFSTGLRGIAAPFVGFALLGVMPMRTIVIIGCAMILISVAMLVPIRRLTRRRGA